MNSSLFFIRGEHPDKRTNAEWVRHMKSIGWDWDKDTKGQSDWKRLNTKE
jgi:hypothetical protein